MLDNLAQENGVKESTRNPDRSRFQRRTSPGLGLVRFILELVQGVLILSGCVYPDDLESFSTEQNRGDA